MTTESADECRRRPLARSGPPPLRLRMNPLYALLPIQLHGPFDADQRNPEGAGDIRLLGVAIEAKHRGDKPVANATPPFDTKSSAHARFDAPGLP